MGLPEVNAALNVAAAALLAAGYACVRTGRVRAHRACMLAATAVSAAFLGCYLAHHARVGHVSYPGQGGMKTLYLAILLSHMVLAASLAILVPMTLGRALKGELDRHRLLARWTLPIWFYVSVTGVVVYLMLYRGGTPIFP